MSTAIAKVDKGVSLGEQIAGLERRVLKRQQEVRAQAKALSRDVRYRLTSPTGLLTAAGIGFVAGIISNRAPSARPAAQAERRPSAEDWHAIAVNLAINALHVAIPKILAHFLADSRPPSQTDSPLYDQPVS